MTDKNNKLTAVEVYTKVVGIKAEHRDLDLFTDARSERGMLRDWQMPKADIDFDDEDWGKFAYALSEEEAKKLEAKANIYADKKIVWREKQRVEGQHEDIYVHTRLLTEDELEKLRALYFGKYLGILEKTPQSKERVDAKNYYQMATYRLLKKAKANIQAVEKGVFGLGH